MNGIIESCLVLGGTAAFFGLAFSQLRGLRHDVVDEGVSNRFLVVIPGTESDMHKPQHIEYVMGSDERPLESGLRIGLPKDKPYGA